jgi:spore maturation protein CgeB
MVMWNISHPYDVAMEEYRQYDLINVASRTWANTVQEKLGCRVHTLLQCTDTEIFNRDAGGARQGVILVGNYRNRSRECVQWAVELGIPVKVWGKRWEGIINNRHIVANHIANQELPSLYSRSMASLNEHWPDMKAEGFLNNRVLDALACGLPVISDRSDGLMEHFGDDLIYYGSRDELRKCVETAVLSYPQLVDRTGSAREKVLREFSFEGRIQELTHLVEMSLQSKALS